jgi:hypothetical protein
MEDRLAFDPGEVEAAAKPGSDNDSGASDCSDDEEGYSDDSEVATFTRTVSSSGI